jgi:hypothetical protein
VRWEGTRRVNYSGASTRDMEDEVEREREEMEGKVEDMT